MKQKVTAEELIKALHRCGHDPRPYSGRHMHGRHCVAAGIDYHGQAGSLKDALEEDLDTKIAMPRTDNLGRGAIAYWPQFELADDHPFVTGEAA